MPLKVFSIVFDNANATFYSGETLSGKILIESEKARKIRGIKIHFTGEAKTGWTETKQERHNDGSTSKRHIHYNGHETYLDNRYYLAGGEGSEITLGKGEHCYPFRIYIPDNCPTSFEGTHGSIRYSVKVVIDRPWKFDYEATRGFTVFKSLNLNERPEVKEPIKRENSKTFCCMCCTKGSLTLVMLLPSSGYVPRQKIPVTVEIDNPSSVNIEHVKAYIKKKITFTVNSPSRKTRNESERIAEIEFGSVQPGGSKTKTKEIEVPNTSSSGLNGCGIIDVDYYLKVKACPEGCHLSLDVKSGITLGTIPLNSIRLPSNWSLPLPPMHNVDNRNNFPPPGYDKIQDPDRVPLLPPVPPHTPFSGGAGGVAPPPMGFVIPEIPPPAYNQEPGYPISPGYPPTQPGYPTKAADFSYDQQPGYPLNPQSPPEKQSGYPPPPTKPTDFSYGPGNDQSRTSDNQPAQPSFYSTQPTAPSAPPEPSSDPPPPPYPT